MSTSFPDRHVDAVRQCVLHVSCVDLVHVGFTLQVWCHQISIRLPVIVVLLLVEVVPRNARDILQVVQRGNLRHLRRERREHLAAVIVGISLRLARII